MKYMFKDLIWSVPGYIVMRLSIFLASRPPMSVCKKIQPNQSSRLAGYTQLIYIYTNVLFYLDILKISRVIIINQ